MDSLFFPPYSKLIRFFHEQSQAFAIFDVAGDIQHMNANFSALLWRNNFDDDKKFSLFHTLHLDSQHLDALNSFDTYIFEWPFDENPITCTLQKDIQYYYLLMDLPEGYRVHIDHLLENTPIVDAQDPFTLSLLFANMDIAVCLCELVYNSQKEPHDFYIRFVNPAFERLATMPKSELIGSRVRNLYSLFDTTWFCELERAEHQNAPIRLTEYIASLKAYFHITISPSSLHHFLVICEDITDQVRAEQTLMQSDKMKVIGQLAGGIAHDFNNQLQIMQSYGDLMVQHLENHSDPTMVSYLNSLLVTISHSSMLIHQLLNHSNNVTNTLKPLHLNDVIHTVKDIFHVSLQKNIQLQLFLEAQDPIIHGDSALIQNALLNLCINSRDALNDGGIIKLSTHTIHYDTPIQIGLTQLNAGNYVRCSVWDNGDGIETDDLYTIFEPFFTTKANKGTGMGLSAVDSMIKHHHGGIDVHSARHEWTQFDLYFPILNNPVIHTESTNVSEDYVRQSYRILIVDDEPVLSNVISHYLETEGYTVHSYTDPQKILDDVAGIFPPIDIALFDILMPKMNGIELLRQLLTFLPDIRCIFLSGTSANDNIPSDIASHVLAQIKKPVNLHDLHTTIQRLLTSESILSD